ncbi:long-chain-fatty-acid--CoA ligase [Dongia deserti]|uniref:long-chain-fatty-acid--CoA ligase n=1 Tax=Dongia deserti TaxID=2268030 RepID=UPI000E6564CA|nr:long-chain fatty acid--CoA ligase [Dongia deserti]
MTHVSSKPAASWPWLRSYPPGIDWHTRFTPRPLYRLLDEAAGHYGPKPCIDFLDRRWSFTEIRQLSDRFARGLIDLGVKPGDRVGLFLPNCPYFVTSYYGILKAGGVVVNFSPLYADREIEHQIIDSGVTIMVTMGLEGLVGKLRPQFERTPLRRIIVCSLPKALPFAKRLLAPFAMAKQLAKTDDDVHFIPFEELTDNDGHVTPPAIDPVTTLALLQYTGGTTGVAKGAALTHANVDINAQQVSLWFSNYPTAAVRSLAILPLFHAFAMTCVMNWSLSVGAEMVLVPRFQPEALLKLIDRKKPTAFCAVPTLFTALLSTPGIDSYDLSSIQMIISGGAPLPMEVRQDFERRTGAHIVEGYGLSECSPVTCVNPPSASKAGSIGLPVPATICEIVSLEDRKTVLPPGEIGELTFKGPQVMLGYWNRPDATAETIIDGRLHTGDVGRIDEDGYVFITDRLKEMIIASGFKVYPRNVEEAIYAHPSVKECAVIGVGDSYRGQTVKAVVALKTGETLTTEELGHFLKDKLSPIEMPKIVEFRAELPKTAVGKIQKKVLIEEERAKEALQTETNP